jgi:hypothetical protein
MKLSNSVTLSLSDDDMNALVADALDRNVIYAPGQEIVVENITKKSNEWHIDFTLDDKEKEE